MPPVNPFDQQPSGIDYLNQIAAPAPAAGFDKKTKLILLLCGVIGILSLVFIGAMASRNTGPSPLALAGRLEKMQRLATTYSQKLRDGKLQAANSSLRAILTTATTSIATPLSDYGIDAKKQAKEIASLEPTDKIEAVLDDAYLNSTLDSAYTREMIVQIEETILMIQRLQRGTTKKAMREFLEKTAHDFTNIKKQFGALSS